MVCRHYLHVADRTRILVARFLEAFSRATKRCIFDRPTASCGGIGNFDQQAVVMLHTFRGHA